MESAGIVGARLPRLDAREKVLGLARYSDDLARPGMLHAAFAASPHAHARITGYDLSAALAVPGVAAIVTGEDFVDKRTGWFVKDEFALARGKVLYAGEPVAVVAAVDLATARRAARLVEVSYEELPAVTTIDEALAGATLVHEGNPSYFAAVPRKAHGNVLWETEIAQGDVDKAWTGCDVVIEDIFETQAQHHAYLEPSAALAEADGQGRVTVWSSCQSVHLIQQRIAESLGMPMARVRSIVPRIGGGFGGKGGPNMQPAAALLALRTGKPVKIALSRTEDFETTRCRHPARIRIKTGARRDGTLIAREVDVTLDGGAYTDESPAVLTFALLMARGPYNVPHVRARGRVVYTNKLKSSAFRGFGNPQVTFAGEQQVEEIAAKLGMDPVEIRLKNAIKPGERWIGGQTIPSCALARCLEAVRDAARPSPTPVPPGRKRGIGYTSATHVSGLLSTGANVHLQSDGSVALSVGAVDLGQGSDTILTQVCAEALKLPMERVSFATPDTDSSPYNWKTAASRVTYMCGRAVLTAAEGVRDQILREASEMLECAASDLELRTGGRVGLKGVPGKEVAFADISGRRLYRTGGQIVAQHTFNFDGEPLDPKRATVTGFAFPNLGVYTFGAQAVEVEVDTATGAVKVLKAWAAHDVGRAINPALVEGQIHGGFVQGLGYALSEEMVWDGGRLANPSFMDYKMPGILDAPPEIVPIILEDPEPTGPYGAKGVGEICLVGVAAAVANAVAAATGARVRRLPLTAETVLGAIEREAKQP